MFAKRVNKFNVLISKPLTSQFFVYQTLACSQIDDLINIKESYTIKCIILGT